MIPLSPGERYARSRRTTSIERAQGLLRHIEKNESMTALAAALAAASAAYDAGLHASRDPESQDAINPFDDIAWLGLAEKDNS